MSKLTCTVLIFVILAAFFPASAAAGEIHREQKALELNDCEWYDIGCWFTPVETAPQSSTTPAAQPIPAAPVYVSVPTAVPPTAPAQQPQPKPVPPALKRPATPAATILLPDGNQMPNGMAVEFWRLPDPNLTLKAVPAIAMTTAAVDGVAPVGDVVGAVMMGGAVVYYLVQGGTLPQALSLVSTGFGDAVNQVYAPYSTLASDAWIHRSADHQEYGAVISLISSMSPRGKIIQKGDGCSGGSIEMRAGVDQKSMVATIGGIVYFCKYAAFFALKATVATSVIGNGSSGWRRLGESAYWYQTKSVRWDSAWYYSKEIGNQFIEANLLPAPQARLAWESTKAIYGLTIPVMEIYFGG